MEASNIYADAELVSISPTSTAVRDGNFNLDTNFVFRTAPTDQRAVEDIIAIIEERGYARVGIVHQSEDPYSRSLKEQVETNLNADILLVPSECDIDSLELESSEMCREIIRDGGCSHVP